MMISTTPPRPTSRLLQISSERRFGSNQRPARRLASAFTLVELLVVIGIIALLISILLPALARARESGNSIKCQAQARQIIQAMVTHASDHHGYMPLVGLPAPGFSPVALEDPRMERYDYFGTDPSNYHVMSVLGALAPLLSQPVRTETLDALQTDIQKGPVRNLFVCPSDHDGGQLGSTVYGGGVEYNSYAFNEAALGWASSTAPVTMGLRSIPRAHCRLRARVASFVHPAELFLFTDGAPRHDGGWEVLCDGDADLTLRDYFVTTNGPPNNPHASFSPMPGLCSNWDVFDTKRHHGRFNVAFADGHVENVLMTESALTLISANKDFPSD